MGACCHRKTNISVVTFRASLQMIKAIQQDSKQATQKVIRKYYSNNTTIIDPQKPMSTSLDIHLSPLGYALYIGSTKSFKAIYQNIQVSLEKLNHQFQKIGKSPIQVICEMGYMSLLEYYLPLYLNQPQTKHSEEYEQVSLFSIRKTMNFYIRPTVSPIRKAVENGHIDIVNYFRRTFKNEPPYQFNVHHIDESTGENCALVSCKAGDLQMVKFLHQICKADFFVRNLRNEGAVQIAAVWSKKHKKESGFLEVIQYLIEDIGVKVQQYQELLLVLEKSSIIQYIEHVMRLEGQFFNKKEVEEEYRNVVQQVPYELDFQLKIKLDSIRGRDFCFRDIFSEELKRSEQSISSISLNYDLKYLDKQQEQFNGIFDVRFIQKFGIVDICLVAQ